MAPSTPTNSRVWHIEPSLTDPDVAYAGAEDAAMFKTVDGGRTWKELASLRNHPSGATWMPGAGGLGLHTILLDPKHAGAHVHCHLRGGGLPQR